YRRAPATINILLPYTTLFRSHLQVFEHENINDEDINEEVITLYDLNLEEDEEFTIIYCEELDRTSEVIDINNEKLTKYIKELDRSEEHTSELQSRFDIVCRLL